MILHFMGPFQARSGRHLDIFTKSSVLLPKNSNENMIMFPNQTKPVACQDFEFNFTFADSVFVL